MPCHNPHCFTNTRGGRDEVEEEDVYHPDIVTLRATMRCKKCDLSIPLTSMAIDTAVTTCKVEGGCGLKDMQEFMVRHEAKMRGEPKKQPIAALLQQPNNVVRANMPPCAPRECNERIEKNMHTCPNCPIATEHLIEHLRAVVDKSKEVVEKPVTANDTFYEVKVDEPIRIFMAKNGAIEHRPAFIK